MVTKGDIHMHSYLELMKTVEWLMVVKTTKMPLLYNQGEFQEYGWGYSYR